MLLMGIPETQREEMVATNPDIGDEDSVSLAHHLPARRTGREGGDTEIPGGPAGDNVTAGPMSTSSLRTCWQRWSC